MNRKLTKMILALARKRVLYLSDKKFLTILSQLRLNRKIDIENPVTFNEKLQWLKLYDRNPLYTTMVDKYEAKRYVSNILGEEYIIPNIGIYENFSDINFDILPNKFVIKCTHDSGGNIICKDKEQLNLKEVEKKLKHCLERNYFYANREWPYKNVKPRILIEKYMASEEQPELIDYKFFCFNGEPKLIYVSQGLEQHSTARISFADMNYNMTNFYRNDYKPFEKLPDKPKNFEKMKEFARKLSKGITFIRVDFYEINSKLYFGELTFFPCSGFIPFVPEEYDRILGERLKLPKEKRK